MNVCKSCGSSSLRPTFSFEKDDTVRDAWECLDCGQVTIADGLAAEFRNTLISSVGKLPGTQIDEKEFYRMEPLSEPRPLPWNVNEVPFRVVDKDDNYLGDLAFTLQYESTKIWWPLDERPGFGYFHRTDDPMTWRAVPVAGSYDWLTEVKGFIPANS